MKSIHIRKKRGVQLVSVSIIFLYCSVSFLNKNINFIVLRHLIEKDFDPKY